MEPKVKVVYIISETHNAVAFEWISQYINVEKFGLSFILLNAEVSILENYLDEHGFLVRRVRFRGKKDWLSALRTTLLLLKELRPDVIHCHIMHANIVGLTAGKLVGIKKRVYTRHHSSLHHIYFKKGVLWDRLCNKLATHIVVISESVRKIVVDWEKAAPSKVMLIPHGFDLKIFSTAATARVEMFRKKHQIEGRYPVVGVIARLTEWKGVQYIIPAFKNLLEDFPNALLLLLNGHGDYEQTIINLLDQLPSESYRRIKFENDVVAAYKSMDVFVHVPVDEHSEAFGQVYIESLAAEVPSIFTLSGIAPDFIRDRYNALVVPFKDSVAIYKGLQELLGDLKLRDNLKRNGLESAREKFEIHTMINALEQLYEK